MTELKEKTDKAQKNREIRENRRINYDNFASFLPLANLRRKMYTNSDGIWLKIFLEHTPILIPKSTRESFKENSKEEKSSPKKKKSKKSKTKKSKDIIIHMPQYEQEPWS